MANLVDISKRMVGVLRHSHYGAVLEEQSGWISVATLAALLRMGEDVILQVLRSERQKRFETEDRAGEL